MASVTPIKLTTATKAIKSFIKRHNDKFDTDNLNGCKLKKASNNELHLYYDQKGQPTTDNTYVTLTIAQNLTVETLLTHFGFTSGKFRTAQVEDIKTELNMFDTNYEDSSKTFTVDVKDVGTLPLEFVINNDSVAASYFLTPGAYTFTVSDQVRAGDQQVFRTATATAAAGLL
nr:MAG TPA: hypothetical protein [Caudoviricetes sp.]